MTTEEKRHLQLIPAGVQKRMGLSALADGVNIPGKTYWDFWYEIPAGYLDEIQRLTFGETFSAEWIITGKLYNMYNRKDLWQKGDFFVQRNL